MYTVKSGEVYFLLGKDRQDNTFSDFGGRSEEQDNGDPRATALRECYEETVGVVLDPEAIEARLNDPKCYLEIVSRTMGNNPYICYVVYIPYIATYASNFRRTLRFLKYIKCHRKYLEKSEIGWFSMGDVFAAAEGRKPVEGVTPFYLRDVFAATVRLARDRLCGLKIALQCYPAFDFYAGSSPPKSFEASQKNNPREIA
jgi:hypothetical protein